jgi:hypothetical protein
MIERISWLCAGMFALLLMNSSGANWFLVIFGTYLVSGSVFEWFYKRIFIVGKPDILHFGRYTQARSGEPIIDDGISGNIFGGIWRLWKSIAVMGGLFTSVLAVLWFSRSIEGRSGEAIFQIPDVASWPEYVATGWAILIILGFATAVFRNFLNS